MIWIIDVLVPLSPLSLTVPTQSCYLPHKNLKLACGNSWRGYFIWETANCSTFVRFIVHTTINFITQWQYIRRSVTFTIVQKTIKETLFWVSGAGIHYSIITTTDNSITSPIMVGGNLICFHHTPDLIGWCIYLTYHPEAGWYLATYLRDISPVYRPNLV